MTGVRSVFFNFFATAKPYVSAKITHGTPCSDLRVQRNRRNGRRSESFRLRVSKDRCPQRSQEVENL